MLFSYIRGDGVESFVENYFDQHYKEENIEVGDNPWEVSYVQARKHLQERFTDANLKRQAQIKVESLYQGTDTAEDFFQKFKLLLTQASYARDSEYVTRLIELNVNEKIIDQIYASTDLPENYEEWKHAVTKLDAIWK